MGYFKQFTQGLYYLIRSFKMINKKKFLMVLGFLLVFILLFAFNSKVFAAEDEDIQVLNGASVSNSKIISDNSKNVYYVSTSSDFIYTIHLNYNISLYVSTDSPSIGGDVSAVFLGTSDHRDYTFVGGDFYLCALGSSYETDAFTITKVPVKGMIDTTEKLTSALTLQDLWSQFNPAVILIAIGVLFALGFYLFKRTTNGTSKHQAKI